MNLIPGLQITESIQLRSLLGEGGMGQAWSAYDASLRREVAVKFLSGPFAGNPAAFERFSLEARTMARLSSPYVPQVFDFGALPGGEPFIVMELLEGVSLRVRLEEAGCLSLAQTERLVTQMGSALSMAHGLGVVHRDVKPENIILVPSEGDAFTAKLLDFGIVKALDETGSATHTGTTIGTPSYMAPEQLLGDKGISAQADLWSLAVVAYSALTGDLPFAGETFGSVCLSIHAGAFVDATARRPGLPGPLDEWFRRALRLAPEERFASAAEMAACFSAAAAFGSLEQPQRLALGPGPTDSDALAFLRTRSMAPARRPSPWALRVGISLAVVAALVLATRRSMVPGSRSDWSVAGHLGRTLVGALGQRATTFANAGPPVTPDGEEPVRLAAPELDAQAPAPVPTVAPRAKVPPAPAAKEWVPAPIRSRTPVQVPPPALVQAPLPASDNPYINPPD
jgi:serine/threonine protein kinase